MIALSRNPADRFTTATDMADALEQTVALVRQIAMPNATPASYAVVVSDGANLVALRTATHGVPPTLHTIVAGKDAPVPAGARIKRSPTSAKVSERYTL